MAQWVFDTDGVKPEGGGGHFASFRGFFSSFAGEPAFCLTDNKENP